jgi:tetratricopeptide (TPR) repeat protein
VIGDAEPIGERSVLAHAYSLLDWAYLALGVPERATNSELALEIYAELGDLQKQASIYNTMGARAYLQGRWTDAAGLYEQAREIRERIGDPVYEAMAAYNIAEILTDQGNLQEAEALLTGALRVWRASGWRWAAATASRMLGRIKARSGRYDEALSLLAEAEAGFREVGAQRDLSETKGHIAECYLLQGKSRAALDLVMEALPRAEKAGGFEIPMLMRMRAYALLQLDAWDEARAAFDESLQAARARKMDYEVALSLEGRVRMARPEDRVRAEERERDSIFERLGVVSVLSIPVPVSV